MNHTVTRIVELLFQDLIPSEEVTALHDEVLTNCQERFSDLVSSGMNEDDAIAAVVESLKGMEQVLADYPRAGQDPFAKPACEPQAEEEDDTFLHLNPADIKRVEASLRDADLKVAASENSFTLNCHGNVRAKMNAGVLTIYQVTTATEKKKHAFTFEGNINSFSDLLSQVGKGIGQALSSAVQFVDNRAEVTLPACLCPVAHLKTVSGDIRWQDVQVSEAVFSSTSGDLTLLLPAGIRAASVTAETMSGDIVVEAAADVTKLKSVSGDVHWEGKTGDLCLKTTSGDSEMNGEAIDVTVNTVSGDQEAYLSSTKRVDMQSISGDMELDLNDIGNASTARIHMKTVSGDAEVSLPEWVDTVFINQHTRSGDCTIADGLSESHTAPIQIDFSSHSGDLNVGKN